MPPRRKVVPIAEPRPVKKASDVIKELRDEGLTEEAFIKCVFCEGAFSVIVNGLPVCGDVKCKRKADKE